MVAYIPIRNHLIALVGPHYKFLYQFFEEILAGINFPVHFFKLLQVLVIYSSHAHGCLLGSVERYLIKCYANFSTEFVEHN